MSEVVLPVRMGRGAEALEQLRQAAEGSDAGVRAAAIKAIEALRGRGAP